MLSDWNSKETDTRIIVHGKDATAEGYRSVMICTVDTNVIVLGIHAMQHIKIDEMWLLFGVENKSRYIHP